LVCTPSGAIEVYSLVTSTADNSADADDGESEKTVISQAKYLSAIQVSLNVVDPMYALVTNQALYVIYNTPSPSALATSAKWRKPHACENIYIASGAPNIVCFNLATDEQKRLLPKLTSMELYAVAMMQSKQQPALMVMNIFGMDVEIDNQPTFAELYRVLAGKSAYNPPAITSYPIGISLTHFVENVDIIQISPGNNPEYGIRDIKLEKGDEEGEIIISFSDGEEDEDDVENQAENSDEKQGKQESSTEPQDSNSTLEKHNTDTVESTEDTNDHKVDPEE
jgi:hypothetical protein